MTGDAADILIRKRLRLMTVVTLRLIVYAEQREAGQVVIEEHRILPVDFSMATFTLRAQHALVWIVIQVARLTAGHELNVENWFDVAVITGDFDILVSTEKFEIRMDVMIEERLFPFGTAVAGVTLIAIVLIMSVIFEMARRARHVHLVLKRMV